MTNAAPIQTRPYRSHKVPACTRCRSRKIRCHIDIPGEPCLSCRERRLKCQYVESPTANNSPTEDGGSGQPAKRRRHSEPEDGPVRIRAAPVLHKPSTNLSASIILAPHIAEDVDIFNRHISLHQNRIPNSGNEDVEPSKYQTLRHDLNDPVVYTSVPRFRTGLPPGSGCGREQLEVVEQIMGPFKREVVELYFSHVHYHFPILDDETCEFLRAGQFSKVANNVMCVVYAMASPLWTRSDTLKMHPRPDNYYVWNKGISATLEDFLSPGMSTIQAAVLDQIGRPSVSIVGNITLCGRTIALAQTFGLHRDPSKWNITENEKSVRMRLWWCCLITDHWSSIAYGAPPYVSKGYYDVTRPTVHSLISQRSTPQQKHAATCFVHLCELTELLGDILPLVYKIDPDREDLARQVTRLKRRLEDMENQMPSWMPLPNRAGSSMLWLCFLSIRLMLARVTFRSAILDGDSSLGHARMEQLRLASSSILDFVLSLGESQFQDFWLPYATQILVHAITVSLRCTVETKDSLIRGDMVSKLQRVVAHIQFARDNYDWDIAIYALERCAEPVQRIASLNAREAPEMEVATVVQNAGGAMEPPPVTTLPANFDDTTFLLSDVLDPNAFDFSWDALWDTPSAMTNFSI
ncbi:hypothetical protein ACEQ8H_007717 [Pleosporales sp. CAS-2024a]